MRRNFYVWGWAGQLNAGDDIFAYVTAWGLRRFMNAKKLFMDADANGVVSRVCGISCAEKTGWRIPGSTRLRRMIFRSHSDCFVLAGGTLLPNEAGVDALLADTHWHSHKRCMIAIGLSVGPFVSGNHEKKTAQLLDTMAYVAFRDDYSYEWAKAAGVKTQIVKAFDLAVLFPLAAPMAAAPKVTERVVGISLLPAGYRGATDQLGPDIDFARVVGASLSGSLKERGAKIVYLSLCTNRSSDDRLLSDAFTKACGGISVERFEHNGDPVRTYNKILSCSHIVSMRLHGGIMAYTAGIPFVQIEYHRKCVDFAESIGLADGHRISMNEACDGKLAGRFTDLLKTSSVSARMNLQEAQERARLNFRTISL